MNRIDIITIMWFLVFTAVFSCPLKSIADNKAPGTDEYAIIWTDRDVYIAGEHLFYTFNLISSDLTHVKPSRLGYMAIRGPHGLVGQMKLMLSDHGNTHGSMYLSDTLSTGFYEIIGFSNWMRNAGESQYFRKQILIANRFDEEIPRSAPLLPNHETAAVAHTDEAHPLMLQQGHMVGKRQKASLTINMQAYHETIISLQVAAVPAGSLHDFQTAMYAEPIVRNEYFFFHRETNNPIISAKLTDKVLHTPVQGARVILNVTDTITNILYAETDHDGTVHFLLDNYHNNKELIFSLENKEDQEKLKLEVINPFDFQYPYRPLAPTGHELLNDYIEESQEILGILKTFKIDYIEKELVGYESVNPPLLYKSPLVTIDLDDYFPLDNLREISRELIPSWRMRSTSSGIQHSIVCQTSRAILSGEPVFFVDGVIQTDITPWLHMGSADLKKIHLMNLDWMHGDFHMSGIISIFTREPSLHTSNLGVTSIFNDTSYLSDAIAQPDYGDQKPVNHGIPDLRRLIYWNSFSPESMHENIALNWYTCDLAGDYIIRVMALTEQGREIRNEIMITIKADTEY